MIPKTVMIEPADTKKRGFMGAVKVDRPVFLCYIKGCEIWAPGAFAGCLTRSLAGSGSGANRIGSAYRPQELRRKEECEYGRKSFKQQ